MTKIIIPIVTIVLILICGYWVLQPSLKYPLPKTATNVSLEKYSGKWYEIGLIPNSFERGCSCTTATYTLLDKYIKVANRCFKTAKNRYTEIEGKAWSVSKNNSKIKVQFYWPFRGDYWVLYVDKYYRYALVGSPNRKYLWILARGRKISAKNYDLLLSIAKKRGYDARAVIKTMQNCKVQK